MVGVFQSRKVRQSAWRHAVVVLAILAIGLGVATRTIHQFSLQNPSAQAVPAHAMRQHLAADAVEITSPILPLAQMLLPVVAPHAPPAEPRVHSVEFSEVLYNRPPPALFLLH